MISYGHGRVALARLFMGQDGSRKLGADGKWQDGSLKSIGENSRRVPVARLFMGSGWVAVTRLLIRAVAGWQLQSGSDMCVDGVMVRISFIF